MLRFRNRRSSSKKIAEHLIHSQGFSPIALARSMHNDEYMALSDLVDRQRTLRGLPRMLKPGELYDLNGADQ